MAERILLGFVAVILVGLVEQTAQGTISSRRVWSAASHPAKNTFVNHYKNVSFNDHILSEERHPPSTSEVAAMDEHLNVVHILLKRGADINTGNSDGMTALHEAAKHGHSDIVKELLSKGADPNRKTTVNYRYTPLQLAAIYGHLGAVKELVRGGADINIGNSEGMTALHEAAKNGQSDIAKELLSKGADPNSKTTVNYRYTPLQLAAIYGHLGAVKELVRGGADISIGNSEGMTALHEAAKNGQSDIVKELLSKGADPNSKTTVNYRYTPLQLAAIYGHLDVVKELVRGGADINIGNSDGMTALHEAAKNGQSDIAKELLSKGADPNSKTTNYFRYTPLQLAAIHGHLNVVKELLNERADINTGNSNGMTALHEAIKHGHILVIKELISRGANPNLKTPQNISVIDLAPQNIKEILSAF